MNRSTAPQSKKSDKKEPEKKLGRRWDDELGTVNNETISKFDHSKRPGNNKVELNNKADIYLGEADPDNLNDRSIEQLKTLKRMMILNKKKLLKVVVGGYSL